MFRLTCIIVLLAVSTYAIPMHIKITEIDYTVEKCSDVLCSAGCLEKGHLDGKCANSICQCLALGTTKSTNDVTCEDGGQAACWSYCRIEGCSSGHCTGSHPNEECECTGCSDESSASTLAKDINQDDTSCSDNVDCEYPCRLKQCIYGDCVDGQCVCHSCSLNETVTKVEKHSNLTDASCTYGGRAACIASCKIQGCDTGYCTGTAPNEVCVCSRCSSVEHNVTVKNQMIKELSKTTDLCQKDTCVKTCSSMSYSDGHCNVSNPFQCNCNRSEQSSVCDYDTCGRFCVSGGCAGGVCVGGRCGCFGCPVEKKNDILKQNDNLDGWCTDSVCAQKCFQRGRCTGGYCINPNQCDCTGCPH